MLIVTTALLALNVCQNWNDAKQVGLLDYRLAPEASGIAVSRAHDGHLYHVSDSGSDGHFVLTGPTGEDSRRIKLNGFTPIDAEDLALGSCGRDEGGNCLFIADIGDNDSERSEIAVALVREKAQYSETETPLRILRLRYPDGAHNAESLAVHPNGDIFIVTHGASATLYKLAASAWQVDTAEPLTLTRVGDLNFGTSLRDDGTDDKVKDKEKAKDKDEGDNKDRLVTSLDISSDGQRFLLLTYKDAYEFEADLSSLDKVSHLRSRQIKLDPLKKQESIAYLPDGLGFIYSTESKKKSGPLMQVSCAD